MGSTAARPLGVTVVALMVIFQGVFSIVIGLSLTEVISLLPVPSGASASATGSAMIIVGILNTVIGLGLFSMRCGPTSSPSSSWARPCWQGSSR